MALCSSQDGVTGSAFVLSPEIPENQMKYVKQLSDIGHQIAQDAESHNMQGKQMRRILQTYHLTGGREFQAAVAGRRNAHKSLVCTLRSGEGAGSPLRLGSFSLLSGMLERKSCAERQPWR